MKFARDSMLDSLVEGGQKLIRRNHRNLNGTIRPRPRAQSRFRVGDLEAVEVQKTSAEQNVLIPAARTSRRIPWIRRHYVIWPALAGQSFVESEFPVEQTPRLLLAMQRLGSRG
jgi:hypothetical protein